MENKPDCHNCVHFRQIEKDESLETCGLTEIMRGKTRCYLSVTTARNETGICQPEGKLFQSVNELQDAIFDD